MFGTDNRISNLQVAILMIHTVIGVGVLSLPSTLAEMLGTTGWIALIITGGISSILVFMMTRLMAMYKGQNLFDISSELMGRPLAYVSFVIIIIHLLGHGAFVSRIFGEVIKMFLLFSTPIEVTIVTFILTAVYTVRSGIEGMARFSIIIIPFIVIPLSILGVVILPDLDFTNLLPFLGASPMEIIKSIPTIFFSFGGIEFLLIYMYYSKKPESAMKYNIGAIVVITILYLLSFFFSLARFGEKGLAVQLWPLLSLSKAIQFPNAFVENVEGIIMAIWIVIAFTTLISSIFGASVLIGKMCKVEEYKYFTLPLLPIIYFVSLIPRNVVQVYDYVQIFTFVFGTFASLAYPMLLYVLAVFKKKGEAKKNENIM
ncbi:Spore germination protein yndE [Proteiniborus sp. DW1]|uniref:GerAB/ArcD/ProY family transporter n=1 Tax=Proteiniborus sp. DW1 TaxID=1889883 RepID=UPI00092DF85B|nr:endospore germination permease [Proteiniborus sp. DW1]SCG81776.1 Spore germination protein yndE [Proteiniborus sp. DW1]